MVSPHANSYPIWIGEGLLQDTALWRTLIHGKHVLIVTNDTIAALYLDNILHGVQGLISKVAILPDGEQFKTLTSANILFDALVKLEATRDATIIALGGGMIGDIAGFAAACWMRGISFIQMPTSLLAQVDASVGGKTGVNLPAGKNLIGAFHQPSGVVIDTTTLNTLPEREYRSGLSEIVKYAAICDAHFFNWLEQSTHALNQRSAHALIEAIATSCRHKARIVSEDEREEGLRTLLNFGHTFGHALEAEAGYGSLLHGEAVAIGMVLAAKLAYLLKRAPSTAIDRLTCLLQALHLPTQYPTHLNSKNLLKRMYLDKKSRSGHLRFILWQEIGQAEIVENVPEAAILEALNTQ